MKHLINEWQGIREELGWPLWLQLAAITWAIGKNIVG